MKPSLHSEDNDCFCDFNHLLLQSIVLMHVIQCINILAGLYILGIFKETNILMQ